MAANNAQTTPDEKVDVANIPSSGKKKVSRKTAGTASKTARASAPAPIEILFKEEPQQGPEPVPPYIWIDHPVQSERLLSNEYVIRLGVGGAEAVEIAIDKAAWQPCRLTSGYWWFDWKNIKSGKHVLTARMKTAGGQWYKTPPRSVELITQK